VPCPAATSSEAFTDADAARFAASLPDARWVKVEHAGHTIQGDNPRGLVRVLKEFLAEIEQARSRRAPREFVAPRFRGCGEKRRGEPIVMVTAS